MKKSRFEKIQEKCKNCYPCDCGMSELCDHNKNDNGICEEEDCPKLKKRK